MITKEYTEKIQHVDYDSSTVKCSRYNYTTNMLTVFFNTKKLDEGDIQYDYTGVSSSDYEAFRDSDSQGKFLNQTIKGNYEYMKII